MGFQGPRQGTHTEVKRASPVATSLASNLVPELRRQHDFTLGHLGFF